MSIFTKSLFKNGQECYAFLSPFNKPSFIIRVRCKVECVLFCKSEPNVVRYNMKIQEIYDSEEYLLKWLPDTEWLVKRNKRNQRVKFKHNTFKGDVRKKMFTQLGTINLPETVIFEHRSDMERVCRFVKDEMIIDVKGMLEQLMFG